MQVTADTVIRNAENRRIGILVNRNNALTVLHTCKMLNRTGDTRRNIDTGTNGFAGLSNLMVGTDITCFNSGAACTDNTAENICKFFNEFETFRTADTPAAGYDDISVNKVNFLLKGFYGFNNASVNIA